MDISNISSIKSLIINRKIVHTPIKPCFFFMLILAEKSPEILPKHNKYFFISEFFALN